MAPRKAPQRLYARLAAAADRGAWSIERDIEWNLVDRKAALERPDHLAQLRDAALIESFHPVNLPRLMRLLWDDVDASVVFSLELYEGFKHFHALRRYLEVVGYAPAITDGELVMLRGKAVDVVVLEGELVPRLVDFMLSEHLAAYFFRRIGEQTREPVLRRLMGYIAADEVRHAQSASDLLAKRIAADAHVIPQVLEAAVKFRHFGEEAVGTVPVAQLGDAVAIATFAKRIERLCGVRLVDHLKQAL